MPQRGFPLTTFRESSNGKKTQLAANARVRSSTSKKLRTHQPGRRVKTHATIYRKKNEADDKIKISFLLLPGHEDTLDTRH